MRLHIIEDFADAQMRAGRVERLWRWVAWRQEQDRIKAANEYERQVVATIPVRGPLRTCPNCGGLIEYRPGSTRLFHTGDARQRCAGATLKENITWQPCS